MPKIKKSDTNTTYFEDIPKENNKTEKVLNICSVRRELRAERESLLIETREKRKRIYNLSLDIEEIDKKLDEMIKNAAT